LKGHKKSVQSQGTFHDDPYILTHEIPGNAPPSAVFASNLEIDFLFSFYDESLNYKYHNAIKYANTVVNN